MNYQEAKSKVRSYTIIGITIALPSTISTIISMLKMLFFRLDDGTTIGTIIAEPIKYLVLLINENTQALDFFWQQSPTPVLHTLINKQNLFFIAINILLFIGLAIFSAGRKLNRRLNKINQNIEEQLISESIKGCGGRNRRQLEEHIEISSSTIFPQFHQLYLAPVVVAVVSGVFLKLISL
jgi:hypothetical protein